MKVKFKVIINANYQIKSNDYPSDEFNVYPTEEMIMASVLKFREENRYLNVNHARVEKLYLDEN